MASVEQILTEWKAHPCYVRVAGWLATHTKLIKLCDALKIHANSAVDAARVGLSEPFSQAVTLSGEVLEDLELQLDAHSILEDRKLFPFLVSRCPRPSSRRASPQPLQPACPLSEPVCPTYHACP